MNITYIHPTLTALETAMVKLIAAQEQFKHSDKWIGYASEDVDPVRWSRKIEAARGKPEALEALRIEYDESAISAMSYWLSHQSPRRQLFYCDQEVLGTIRDVIAVIEAIGSRSKDSWLKLIMQTRCVEAAQLRDRERGDSRVDVHSPIFNRVHNILVTTFTAFAAELTKSAPSRSYTTDLIVPGRKYKSYLDKSADLRNVQLVDFVDCLNSKHPANQTLAHLMEQLKPLAEAARLAESRLKGSLHPSDKNFSKINNGTINERQHANRLLDALYGQPPGGTPSATQLDEQNERRRLYEGVRQEVWLARRQLQAVYEEICKALPAAVVETQQFLVEVQADSRMTADRWETLRICLNNCLATDLRLRSLGRELKNLEAVYGNDYSQGTGGEAISSKFAEVERIYRHAVKCSAPGY